MIEFKGVWFRYAGRDWVLRGVNLTIHEKETVLLIGKTGSGKTTIAKLITGLIPSLYHGELRGEILVDGVSTREMDPHLLSEKIKLVPQNPYLSFTDPLVRNDLYSHAEEVWEPGKAERAVRKAVEATGISSLLDKYFFELSGGQTRRVVTAKALVSNPRVIVFDEPLMWLDDKGVQDFLKLVETLRFMGKTLIIIEHRFIHFLRSVDRVLVLREGKIFDETEEVFKTLRATLSEKPSVLKQESERIENKARGVVAEVKEVYYNYGSSKVLRGLSLTVFDGDFVVIYGENGSGKTTLLRLLAGYVKPEKGRVFLRGRAVYIPQNISLFYTEETVRREIEEVCKRREDKRGCVEKLSRRAVSIGATLDQSPFTLSHGQQVRLALELASSIPGVQLLLLDEPFSGLSYVDRPVVLQALLEKNIAKIVATSSLEIPPHYLEKARVKVLSDGALKNPDDVTYSRHWLSIDVSVLKKIYGE